MRSSLHRWLVPTLAVLPALALAVWLGISGDSGAESGAADEPVPLGDPLTEAPIPPAGREDPAPDTLGSSFVERTPLAVDPDTLIQRVEDPRALPDTIGVMLERSLPAATSSSIEDYLLWLPPGMERGDRRWPVILYLHGRSLRGDNPSLLLRYGLPRELAEGNAIPFIVVAPQLHLPGTWSDVDRLDAILDEIEARYPVDRSRVYLTGYSMGGGGVWRVAYRHADRFAAAVPMAAHTPAPSEDWSRALMRLPILVFHGSADDLAPLPAAQTMVEALRRVGADVELRLIQGADHGDLTRLYRDPELYAWMLEHRRR